MSEEPKEWKLEYKKEEPLVADSSDQNIRGFDRLDRSKELNIGSGSLVFKADRQGLWLGASQFSNAPFHVSMAGTMSAISGSMGNWTISSTSLVGGSMTIDSSGVIVAGTITDGIRISGASKTILYRLSNKDRIQIGGASPLFIFNDTNGNQVLSMSDGGNETLSIDIGQTATKHNFLWQKISTGTSALYPMNNASLGQSGQYWNEIHYHTLVAHTPDIIEDGIQKIKTFTKDKNGKIEKEKLDRKLTDGNGGLLTDNIIMALVDSVKNIDERLSKLET